MITITITIEEKPDGHVAVHAESPYSTATDKEMECGQAISEAIANQLCDVKDATFSANN